MSKAATRSQPIPEDPFPPIERFHHRAKLPTHKDVIGVMRYMTNKKHAINMVAQEVAKRVYSKWYHDSVFCHSLSTIRRRVDSVWKIYTDYKRRGKETGAAADKYRELKENADKLFDVYTEDKARQAVCEEKEFGVKMSENEYKYLEDMRGERKMECNNGVDPVWFTAVMRRQRKLEWEEAQRLEMQSRFNFKSLDEIEASLTEQGVGFSSTDTSVDTPGNTPSKRLRTSLQQEEVIIMEIQRLFRTLKEARKIAQLSGN